MVTVTYPDELTTLVTPDPENSRAVGPVVTKLPLWS